MATPRSLASATQLLPGLGGAPLGYAHVALFVPLSQAYTFSVPEGLQGQLQSGSRVVCSLRSRQVFGVVLELGTGAAPGVPHKLKPLLAVVEEHPAVPEELLGFLQALASYYLAPIGEVLRLAVPQLERGQRTRLQAQLRAGGQGSGLATASPSVGRMLQSLRPLPDSELSPEAHAAKAALRGQARAICMHLSVHGSTPLSRLQQDFSNARAAAKRLVSSGLCVLERVSDLAPTTHPDGVRFEPDIPPTLNQAQATAVSALTAALDASESRGFLLHGITASGKTEVYLHAARHALDRGGGVLVLVPEIALTPQLSSRFRARLGDTVAVLHSGLTARERYQTWARLRSGEVRVALGARSALFAPIADLRLVCVDEEQDGSFKQEEGVRYNARDMALLRAHRAQAVCVFGSATPSLKSFQAVRAGKLEHLHLPARAHQKAVLPRVQVIDLRRYRSGPTGERWLSLPLYRAIEETLEARQQAILFLNRRGFAPSVNCEACGQIVGCSSCEVAMTYHVQPKPHVICHYCDRRGAAPEVCGACGSPGLDYGGLGTERVEAVVSACFPAARVARLDRDTGAGLKSERLLARMHAGEIDLLVGTQMVTKGHDLPRVTLVGVLNADAGLSLPDFQASERTFQLLVQVAGRAGRGDRPGRVLVQAYNPEHPAIARALKHDVEGFVDYALEDRRQLGYPPFCHLGLVRISSESETAARAAATRLAERARSAAGQHAEVLGPALAPIARLRNRYRYRFLLRSKARAPVRHALTQVLRGNVDRRVRVSIDIDPLSML